MDDLIHLATMPKPTATRPLLGLTVLAVEDSRYACDALRLLCLRSGARIRRADCLASAERHLKVYRPSVLIVDVGLPDGSGLDLIRETAASAPRIEVILGSSGDDTQSGAVAKAGADGFLAKPIVALAEFQQTLLSHLPEMRQPKGPRGLSEEVVQPDPIAFSDDMLHLAAVLEDRSDMVLLDYAARFAKGVALTAQDDALYEAAQTAAREVSRAPSDPVSVRAFGALADLVADRVEHRVAI
ncbi:response regulator [Pseudaestuariivita sp.]|uniref:response regulator n=1 Tax=Pseudaestuariivita sp. TaxID=2211669 RepID=UPI004058E751